MVKLQPSVLYKLVAVGGLLIWRCYSGVTVVLQWCYSCITECCTSYRLLYQLQSVVTVTECCTSYRVL